MNWCILQKFNDEKYSIMLFYKIILMCTRLSGFLFEMSFERICTSESLYVCQNMCIEMARNGYVTIHYSFAMFPDCRTEPRQSLLIVSSWTHTRVAANKLIWFCFKLVDSPNGYCCCHYINRMVHTVIHRLFNLCELILTPNMWSICNLSLVRWEPNGIDNVLSGANA